jgi:hypothetical protein
MTWASRNGVVAGGDGFLGSFVVERLRDRGCRQVFVPRSRSHAPRDRDAIQRLYAETRPDMIIHLAAVHQHHDYSHVRGGREWSYCGPEAVRNVQLAGGPEHLYRIDRASHVLTSRGLRRQRPRWARFEYHWGAWLGRVTWLALEATRPVRHRLGIRAATFRRIRSLVTRWSGKGR